MTEPMDVASARSLFPYTRIVSLASRPDRRRQVAAELARFGFDRREVAALFFDAVRPAGAAPFQSVGAHGCFLSHLAVITEFLASGRPHLLLLEDDVSFSETEARRLVDILVQLRDLSWSVFYGEIDEPTEEEGQGIIEVPADRAVLRAHFLMLTRETATALVPYLNLMKEREPGSPLGGPMDVDGGYSWFRRAHPELRTFAAVPGIAHQRPSRTDIGQQRAVDRYRFLRPIVGAARSLKGWLKSRR